MKKLIIIGLLIFSPLSLSYADVVSIIDLDSSQSAIDKPRSGMTMAQVKEKYGEPETQSGPVGQPPITTWEYPDFAVYFEFNRVIYAVVSPKK